MRTVELVEQWNRVSWTIKYRGQWNEVEGRMRWTVKCCRQSSGVGSEMSCGVEYCGQQVVKYSEIYATYTLICD